MVELWEEKAFGFIKTREVQKSVIYASFGSKHVVLCHFKAKKS